jgi:hypothetical protein
VTPSERAFRCGLAKDDELKATARERRKELMENHHFEIPGPTGVTGRPTWNEP